MISLCSLFDRKIFNGERPAIPNVCWQGDNVIPSGSDRLVGPPLYSTGRKYQPQARMVRSSCRRFRAGGWQSMIDLLKEEVPKDTSKRSTNAQERW